jgi:hypothetical protein
MSFVEDSQKRGLVVLIILAMVAGMALGNAQGKVCRHQPALSDDLGAQMKLKKRLSGHHARKGTNFLRESALFLDGKNYKYAPMGASMEVSGVGRCSTPADCLTV